MTASLEELSRLALSEGEYKAIIQRLGREPNSLELGLLGSLWSEHCAYKHSKPLLKTLASDSPRLLVGQGEENAGVIDIGDGLAIVMKIESHNHPSAIEPYEGAATGVGGIVRDIFAMGARPIALLNSLRFGPLSDPHNRRLFDGVVAGISGYGNCIGIPNVGGEVCFSPSYSENPLVNAMCVGIIDKDKLIRATTGNPGNLLMLVGAETGRDGIHGASGLASRTFEEERELRPTVQVGNPFLEKVLIEACLELARSDDLVGIQDLGAAGLSTACVEAARNGGCGVDIDVSQVARRDAGMTSYEIMLSESQERMLIMLKPDRVEQVKDIFDRWGLTVTVIGKVTKDQTIRIKNGAELEGELPVNLLTDPPMYQLHGHKPERLTELQAYDLESIPLPTQPPNEVLLRLLSSPNIASKEQVSRQYDNQVQINTIVGPGADAAILRIRGTSKGIAMATDGNGRYCYLDPYTGGAIAVAEACRNVSSVGAEPLALTDCLNFGDPEREETAYQLKECVNGMARASKALNTPIISGNVSLYNESHGQAIYPTPIIGAIGLFENVAQYATSAFKHPSDTVVLLGSESMRHDAAALAGSEYLEIFHNLVAGRPKIDLDLERAVQSTCRKAIWEGVLSSAHDCSDGGLAVALAECCIQGRLGFTGHLTPLKRWDAILFGETQSRIVVSLNADKLLELDRICQNDGTPYTVLGQVGRNSFTIPPYVDLGIDQLEASWRSGLTRSLTDVTP